ncbi:MAG: hypothetical protein CVU78_06315, partial [Elusimicrobia bacterium HGW-Elusimicrobia-2]
MISGNIRKFRKSLSTVPFLFGKPVVASAFLLVFMAVRVFAIATFYFKDAAAPSDAPSTIYCTDPESGYTYAAYGTNVRTMGTNPGGAELTWTHTAFGAGTGANNINFGGDIFVSPALKAQTLNSGTWSAQFRMYANGDKDNDDYARICVYVWRNNSVAAVIVSSYTQTTTHIVGTVLKTISFTGRPGAACSILDNDYLVVEVLARTMTNAPANSAPDYIYVGRDTTDSYLTAPQDLQIFTAPNLTSVTPDVKGQGCSLEQINFTGTDLQSDDILSFMRVDVAEIDTIGQSAKTIWTTSGTVKISIPDTVETSAAGGSVVLRIARLSNTNLFSEKAFTISSYPLSAVTSPADSSLKNSVASIGGTANARGGTIANIWIAIEKIMAGDNEFWDGSQWTTTPGANQWLAVTPDTSWSYDSSGVTWDSANSLYQLKSKAKNSYGGIESVGSGIQFRFDGQPPVVTSTVPVNNLYSAQAFNFSGTSSDNSSSYGYGVKTSGGITMRIYAVNVSKYWHGDVNQWVEGEYWCVATGSTSWNYSIATSSWNENQHYQTIVRAEDQGGNFSTVWSTRNFTYDIYAASPEKPDSRVTDPVDGEYRGSQWIENTGISGTASDNTRGGLDIGNDWGIQYAIRRQSDGFWYDIGIPGFKDNSGNPFWNAVNAVNMAETSATDWSETLTADWVRTLSATEFDDGVSYDVISRCRDITVSAYGGPNYEIVYETSTFIMDKGVPSSAILSPVLSHYQDVNTISGTAADTLSDVKETGGVNIRVSYTNGTSTYYLLPTNLWDSVPNVSHWLVCSGSHTWSYNSAAVAWTDTVDYKVEVRAEDKAQNKQTTFPNNTFMCDVSAPASALTNPQTGQLYRRGFPTLIQGTAVDVSSTVAKVYLKIKENSADIYWSDNLNTWVGYSTICACSYSAPNWTYDSDAKGVGWVNGTEYSLIPYARDFPGNAGDGTSRNFTWDVKIPTSAVTTPANASFLNSLLTIVGTGADSTGLINKVYVGIKDTVNLKWWDGTLVQWGAEEWNTAWAGSEPAPIWDYDMPHSTAYWTNNHKYIIYTKAVDESVKNISGQWVGNTEDALNNGTSSYFTFDGSAPESKIDNVTDSSYIKSLTDITGTALDLNGQLTPAGSIGQISSVKIHIYDANAGEYWGGALGWQTGGLVPSDAQYRTVSYTAYHAGGSSGTFVYNSGVESFPSWTPGNQYRLITKAQDGASNKEVTVSTVSFYYDVYVVGPPEYPDSSITYPANNWNTKTTTTTISGSAADNVALNWVYVKIMRLTQAGATDYWQGATWAGTEKWLNYNQGTLSSWGRTVPSDSSFWTENRLYKIISRAEDKALNWEINFTTITVVYDLLIPTAAVTYPANSGYVSSVGKITGTSEDSWPGQTGNVYLKLQRQDNSKYWKGSSSWTAVETWLAPTLSSGGTWWQLTDNPSWETTNYEAYAKCKDKADNWQTVYSTVAFIGDFTAPSSTVTTPANGSSQDSVAVISGAASDENELDYVKIDIKRNTDNFRWDEDNEQWVDTSNTPFWLDCAGSGGWSFTITYQTSCWSNGLSYTITPKAFDKAGNSSVGTASIFNFVYPAQNPFKVSYPSVMTAGVAGNFTVTAWNYDYSATATGYGGDVFFDSSDNYMLVDGNAHDGYSYTYVPGGGGDNGEHIFSVTMKTAGTNLWWKVWDPDTYGYVISSQVVINKVNPGALKYFQVTVNKTGDPNDPAGVTAGVLRSVTVSAYDAQKDYNDASRTGGNPKTNYNGIVHFTSSDGNASIPADYQFTSGSGEDNGVHTWLVGSSTGVKFKTMNLNGAWLRTNDTDLTTSTGAAAGIIVYPNSYASGSFVVSAATGPWTAGVGRATMTVESVDAYGNRCSSGVYNYNGTAKFTSSDGNVYFGNTKSTTVYTFTTGASGDNGYHVFNATAQFRTSGTQWIKAKDESNTQEGLKTGIVVYPGAATHFAVTASTNVTAGASFDVTVEALDQFNNRDTNYYSADSEFDFSALNSDNSPMSNSSFILDPTTFEAGWNGYHPFGSQATLNAAAGTGKKIKVTDTGKSITGERQSIKLNPASAWSLEVFVDNLGDAGAAVTLVAGGWYNMKVRAKDFYGNVDTNYAQQIKFTSPNSSSYLFDTDGSAGAPYIDTYTFVGGDLGSKVFSAAVCLKQTGVNKIVKASSTISGVYGQKVNNTVSAATLNSFAVSGVENPHSKGHNQSWTVAAVDLYGNTVTNYSGTVNFESGASAYTFLPANYKFVTSGGSPDNGIHTFEVSASTYLVFNSTGLLYIKAIDYSAGKEGKQENIRVVGLPLSAVTVPSSAVNYWSNVPGLQGTAAVQHSAATLAKIEINIKNIDDVKWWDGSDWNAGSVNWIEVFGDPWTYAGVPQVSWEDPKEFKIESRSYDNLFGTQTAVGSVQFYVDKTEPGSNITTPGWDDRKNALDNIIGACWDTGSGVDIVKIKISSGAYTWTGSSWSVNIHWIEAAGTGGSPPTGWNYGAFADGVNWSDGVEYNIDSKAWDLSSPAKEQSTAFNTKFTYDVTPPTTTVSNPADGSGRNALNEISGKAGDKNGVSAISDVYICIRKAGPTYWDRDGGTGWGGAIIWNECSGTDNWTLNSSTVTLTDGLEYKLYVKATDAAGNQTNIVDGDITSGVNYNSRFYYDTQDPNAKITYPEDAGKYNNVAALYGTAADNNTTAPGREIDYLKINVYDTTESKTWDGGPAAGGDGWDAGEYDDAAHWRTVSYTAYQAAGSSGTWGYPYGIGDSTPTWTDPRAYRVRIRVYDKAGNYVSYVDTITFTYDTYAASPERPDSLANSISNGDHLNDTFSSISGTAVDDILLDDIDPVNIKIWRADTSQFWGGASWGSDIWLSASGGVSWSRAIPPDPANAFWVENSSYGIITRAKDKAGNYERVFSTVSFIYDIETPDSLTTYPAVSPNDYIASSAAVKGTCYDTLQGITDKVYARLARNSDNKYWKVTASSWSAAEYWNESWLSPGVTSWVLTAPTGDWNESVSLYSLNPRAKDKAGNWESPFSTKTFQADFTDPNSFITEPVFDDYDTLPAIKGTTYEAKTINKIKIDIRRTDNNWRWNNASSTWTATNPYWNEISGASSWQFDISFPTRCWQSGKSYEVTAHAVDGAQNEESDDADNKKSFNFRKAPVTFQLGGIPSNPVAGTEYTVTGTAFDEDLTVASAYKQFVEFECSNPAYTVLPSSYQFTTNDAGVHEF